jgi:hypothetical protein
MTSKTRKRIAEMWGPEKWGFCGDGDAQNNIRFHARRQLLMKTCPTTTVCVNRLHASSRIHEFIQLSASYLKIASPTTKRPECSHTNSSASN